MTKIEWTHPPGYIGVTWNPVTGCTPCSPGCVNCYARRMAQRWAGRYGYPKDDPFRVTVHEDKLDLPKRWRKPRFVFVCSMGDLFHDDVDDGTLEYILGTMATMAQHRFVILTKRPWRLGEWYSTARWPEHFFVGVSVSNQEEADEKVLALSGIDARRIVSVEPMLAYVNLRPWLKHLDWVIVGGETGPGARCCSLDWVRGTVSDCRLAEVPVFVKQAGAVEAWKQAWKSRKGSDPSEWPEWMRVREWPYGLWLEECKDCKQLKLADELAEAAYAYYSWSEPVKCSLAFASRDRFNDAIGAYRKERNNETRTVEPPSTARDDG